MFYLPPTLISIIEVLLVIVPALLSVAYVTVAERKTMASMQRRLGPNAVGYYGLLQAFADALKLLLKEYVAPTQANIVLFFLGPVITLIFALLGYGVIPYGPGLAISDFNLGILYMLAVSSLSTYGILLAGWSANSKYAFLGSLRSTAQLISYELILSSALLLVIMLTGSLNLTVNVEAQRAVWFILPLFPIFIIFFIGSIAETNRPPFDLAEAKSPYLIQFHKYSSNINNSKETNLEKSILHPWWITGFVDAKGCFIINIQKRIWSTCKITQHSRDFLL
jgi:NADH-ubiquinone oxidoreductase chain 1